MVLCRQIYNNYCTNNNLNKYNSLILLDLTKNNKAVKIDLTTLTEAFITGMGRNGTVVR